MHIWHISEEHLFLNLLPASNFARPESGRSREDRGKVIRSRLCLRQQAGQPRSTCPSTAPVADRHVSRFAALLRPQGVHGFRRGRGSYSGTILLLGQPILVVIHIRGTVRRINVREAFVFGWRRITRGTIRCISVQDSFVLGRRCAARGRTRIIGRRRDSRILRRRRFGNLRDTVLLRGLRRGTRGGSGLDGKVSVIVEIIVVLQRQRDVDSSAVLKTIYFFSVKFVKCISNVRWTL